MKFKKTNKHHRWCKRSDPDSKPQSRGVKCGKKAIAVSRCRPTLLMMRDVKVEIENANVVVESLIILNSARVAGLCLVAFVCEMTNNNQSTLQRKSGCPL